MFCSSKICILLSVQTFRVKSNTDKIHQMLNSPLLECNSLFGSSLLVVYNITTHVEFHSPRCCCSVIKGNYPQYKQQCASPNVPQVPSPFTTSSPFPHGGVEAVNPCFASGSGVFCCEGGISAFSCYRYLPNHLRRV